MIMNVILDYYNKLIQFDCRSLYNYPNYCKACSFFIANRVELATAIVSTLNKGMTV